MTVEEKIDRLTQIVDALAATVVAHDNQIEQHSAQIAAHSAQIEALTKVADQTFKETRELSRQLEAYLRRLPPQ